MKLRDEIRIRIKIKIYLQHHAKKSWTGHDRSLKNSKRTGQVIGHEKVSTCRALLGDKETEWKGRSMDTVTY